MLESEFETPRSPVSFRSSTLSVACQILERSFDTSVHSAWVVHQGSEHIAEHVVDALGDSLSRHRDIEHAVPPHYSSVGARGRALFAKR